MIMINVASDFSDAPGGRYAKEGAHSGEEFREAILEPKFLEAKRQGCKLSVDLDGGFGYYVSFLDEAFGGLARKYPNSKLKEIIELTSEDEPGLIERIYEYMDRANSEKKD